MSLEEVKRRYVEGYDYTDRDHRNQLYNDMEWLMDEILRLQNKCENLMTKINEDEVERLRKENDDLIYENIKMKNYIKNYGITHGTIRKPPTP